jgi:hypothetical protein
VARFPSVPPADPDAPRWFSVRGVRSFKPATYRCPFCDRPLHAMSDHVLVAPEGDTTRRRHAHTDCALAARAAGSLPSRDEWRAAGPRTGSRLRRLLGRR